MALSAAMQISDQDIRQTTLNRPSELFGQLAQTSDGRMFALGQNGTGSGTAIAPGKITQGAFAIPNHVNITGVTVAAGTQQVTYTIGATALTANQYIGGYLQVNTGTGAGQSMQIMSHTTSAAGSTAVQFNLKDAFYAATAVADSKFSLQPNPYSKVILEANGTSTAILNTGVAAISVPDAAYAWFQVGGPAAVLIDGTPAVGLPVVASSAVAGAVAANTAALFQPTLGYMMVVGVDTTYKPVFLQINNA